MKTSSFVTDELSPDRARVFVSSVVDGFSDYREAARRGITTAGGRPVLVNEDFPSQPTSPRNACLDAIDTCDYLVSIVGARGGWKASSGLLVVEEEFEHALQRNLMVFTFLQDAVRDADAERFAKRLSNYVGGGFRTVFRTPEELEHQVEEALRERTGTAFKGSVMERDLSPCFKGQRNAYSSMATLRLVLVPTREIEVVDPVRMTSADLVDQIYELGHAQPVRLFSYSRPKSARVEGSTLIVEQTEPGGRHGEGELVRLKLAGSGVLVLDANVTGRARRGNASNTIGSMVVALEDVETVLSTSLRFASALYDLLDPFARIERFHFNVGLLDLGYRKLERNPQPRTQMSMSMRGSEPVTAYDHSRVIARATLHEPRGEMARAVALLTQRAGE